MRRPAPAALALIALVAAAAPAGAQNAAADLGPRLLQDVSVKAALDAAKADEARTIAEQVEARRALRP